jgi:hypothetical protein
VDQLFEFRDCLVSLAYDTICLFREFASLLGKKEINRFYHDKAINLAGPANTRIVPADTGKKGTFSRSASMSKNLSEIGLIHEDHFMHHSPTAGARNETSYLYTRK